MSRRRMMMATMQEADPITIFWRPSATISRSGWQPTSNMHAQLNEEIPSDSSRATCSGFGAGDSQLRFSGATLPGTPTQIILSARRWKSSGSPSTVVSINGVTYIGGATPSAVSTEEVSIPISDYLSWNMSALNVRLQSSGTNNSNINYVSWLELKFIV